MLIFNDEVDVHYGFIQVFSVPGPAAAPGAEDREFDGDHSTAIAGQTNGLAGAVLPHLFSLVTGLHTGEVPLRITWDAAAPALDAEWTDAVEVSVELLGRSLAIQTFEESYEAEVPQSGWHRVRYCGAEMDAGKDLDTPEEDQEAPDRYLLQLWPHAEAPDVVVRLGSATAAYWHRVARGEDS